MDSHPSPIPAGLLSKLRESRKTVSDAEWRRFLRTQVLKTCPQWRGDPVFDSIATLPDTDFPEPQKEPDLPERFKIIKSLGSGGVGSVYEVWDEGRGQRVALKVLNRSTDVDITFFKREFRSVQGLSHPNLASLYEFIRTDDLTFITMELVEGVDLKSWVREGGEINQLRLRDSLEQLCAGLAELHASERMHCDLKPGNILVSKDGRLVIVDFGLVTESSDVTRLDQLKDAYVAGTLAYMAPEQMKRESPSEMADWYAVGVILHELLSGHIPWFATSEVLLEIKLEKRADPLPDFSGEPWLQEVAELRASLLEPKLDQRAALPEITAALGITDFPSAQRGAALGLVGRDDTLHSLANYFSEVQSGRFVAIQVHGNSGVGKSALIEAFLREQKARENSVILSGRCYEREEIPYKGIDELIEQLAGYLRRQPDWMRDPLFDFPVGPLCQVFPSLGSVVGWKDDSEKEINEVQLRTLAWAGLTRLFENLGARETLILALDDLQWTDSDSLSALEAILRASPKSKIFLICMYRRELEESGEVLALKEIVNKATSLVSHEVPVDELEQSEARELAKSFFPSDAQPDEARLLEIIQGAEGNPYFIQTLSTFGWTADGQTSVDEAMWNHLCSFPNEDRHLMEVLATSGRPTRRRDILDAAKLGEGAFGSETKLINLRLIKSSGSGLEDKIEVYHDRIRECLSKHLKVEQAQDWHLRLAETFELNQSGDNESRAIHFEGGRVPKKAGSYFQLAADDASQALAFDRAAGFFARSIKNHDPPGSAGINLREDQAKALARAGRSFDSGEIYRAAAELCESPQQKTELEWLATFQWLICGRITEATEGLHKLLALAELKMDKSPVKALSKTVLRRSYIRVRGLGFRPKKEEDIREKLLTRIDVSWSLALGFGFMEVMQAGEFQNRALLWALKAGDSRRVTRALAMEAIYEAAFGSYTANYTEKLLTRAEEVAKQDTNDPYSRGAIALARGSSGWLRGNFREGIKHTKIADKIFREESHGYPWERDTSLTYQMFGLVNLGDFKELKEVSYKVRDEASGRGDLYLETNAGCYPIPWSLLADDRPEDAAKTANEHITKWSNTGFQAQHLLAWLAQIEAELYQGNGEAAMRLVEEKWSDYKKSGMQFVQHGRIQARYSRARAALMLGIDTQDRSLLAIARSEARKLRFERRSWANGLSQSLFGAIAASNGKTRKAKRHFSRAAVDFSSGEAFAQERSARLQGARLTPDRAGEDMVLKATNDLEESGVSAPYKFANCLCPLPLLKA